MVHRAGILRTLGGAGDMRVGRTTVAGCITVGISEHVLRGMKEAEKQVVL